MFDTNMFVGFDDFYKQNIIENENARQLTIADFCKSFIISYSKPISLADYFEKKKNNENDKRIMYQNELINKLYTDFYTHKKDTCERFFNSYLHPKIHSVHHLQKYFVYKNILDLNSPSETLQKYISMQKNDASKRIIRNIFYKELLQDTIISTSVPKKKSLLVCWKDAFNNFTLDDRYFSPSVIDQYLRGTPIHYFFQQYQPKASIINPYVIYWLLDFYFPKICPHTHSIYTPVLSWGTYGLAFCFTKNWSFYHGTDVMESVCKKTNLIQSNYNYQNKKFYIYNERSEKLKTLQDKQNVDLVLCCPPYYKMELYVDNIENQSTEKYKSYIDWLNNYWIETVNNCYDILVDDGIFAFIIGNYKDYKTRKIVDLISDCNNVFAQERWTLIDKIELGNRQSTLRKNTKTRSEYLFVYRKNPKSKICLQYDTENR